MFLIFPVFIGPLKAQTRVQIPLGPPYRTSCDPPRSITSRRIITLPPVGLDSSYQASLDPPRSINSWRRVSLPPVVRQAHHPTRLSSSQAELSRGIGLNSSLMVSGGLTGICHWSIRSIVRSPSPCDKLAWTCSPF